MNRKIKILHLEDVPSDAMLIANALKKGNVLYDGLVVDSKDKFVEALSSFGPDIILSDHSLPSFNSAEALEICQQKSHDIPFIIITATMSDEFAVDLMFQGAVDYILKDRLSRLPNAVYNALKKSRFEKERKSLLAQLVVSENRFRALVENSADAVVILDELGKPGYVSPAFKNVLGYNEDFGMQMNLSDLLHSDDYNSFERIMRHVLEVPGTSIKGHTGRMLHRDGSWRWIELTLTNLLTDSAVEGIVVNFRDITERKSSEEILRKSEEKYKSLFSSLNNYTRELILSNKGLEQFSYMVSHNLRAPVANIIGLGELICQNEHPQEVKGEFLNGLLDNVKRLNDIIIDLNDILDIKKNVSEKKEAINLNKLVSNIQSSIESLIKKEQVTIHTNFQVQEIVTLSSYLHSIFYNLIINSIKYRQPGITPHISITSELQKDKLFISIKDNGLGIDLKKRGDQIFGLYKRFHAHVEGKGMGLFMVKTQIEMIGGTISVNSEINKGTEFLIEFNNFENIGPDR